MKFVGVASFGVAKVSNPQKFSPRKSIFTNLQKFFSPSKVYHYTVLLTLLIVSLYRLYVSYPAIIKVRRFSEEMCP